MTSQLPANTKNVHEQKFFKKRHTDCGILPIDMLISNPDCRIKSPQKKDLNSGGSKGGGVNVTKEGLRNLTPNYPRQIPGS